MRFGKPRQGHLGLSGGYAQAKGRAATVEAEVVRPPKPLTEQQKAIVAKNKAFVMEHMPEMKDFLGDLHKEGLIDGWRAVTNCRRLDEQGENDGNV